MFMTRRSTLALVISILFCCSLTYSYIGPERSLFKVNKIRIVGLKKIEPEAILLKIGIRPDKSVTNYQINAAVKRIYSMKYFEHVEAHQEGDDLVFKVKEKPVISKLSFTGNSEIDDDDIKDKINTKAFNILDVRTLDDDSAKIRELYEDKGYYLSRIKYDVKESEDTKVKVNFTIEEFDKVKVKKISFIGNEKIPDDELKQFMVTREDSLLGFMSDAGNFKELNFKTDIERLTFYYRTKGHIQANFGKPSVNVSEDRRWIFISIPVIEGPEYKVNEITYDGDLLLTKEELAEATQLKKNEVYSEETLRQDVERLTQAYQDKGYAFVNVIRDLKPVEDTTKKEVRVKYSFEKGEIARFGRISIKGNSKTRDKVIRRELKIHEGMQYSGSKLKTSKANVNRLGFFEPGSVIFNTSPQKGNTKILDVAISVKERQTGQISVGAGYSTQQKGFLQASIKQRNFLGKGQNLGFSLSLSKQQQDYNLSLTEPYFMDTRWSLGGSIYRSQSSFIDSFEFVKQGGNIRVGYPLADYTRLYLSYNVEHTKIKEVRNPTIDPDKENGIASGVELSLIHDKRNNAFEPTKGVYASGSAEFVGIGFDHRWVKLVGDTRFYYPVYKDFVFRSRIRTQKLFKTSDSRPPPRTKMYAMGGSRNMRGYGQEEIGPQKLLVDQKTGNQGWFNTGGLHSVLGTAEIEHPLIKEAGLKWAVFYDIGNVYENYMGDKGDYSLKQNFGFGFRWFSPIGLLRFEFGFPLNRRKTLVNTGDPAKDGDLEKANHFFFDIGQLF